MTRRNLNMYRGDTLPFRITITNAGSAVNLQGAAFRMTAKFDIGDTDDDAVFSITSPSYIVITDSLNGIISVNIPPSATSSLPPCECNLYYDIQMEDGTQAIYTVCSGILTVYPDVSITSS